MNKILVPYNKHSKSCKIISKETGIPIKLRHGGRYMPRPYDLVINWGCSTLDLKFNCCMVLNNPEAIQTSKNKLATLNVLFESNVSIPEYLVHGDVNIHEVFPNVRYFIRHTLTGKGGEGIEVVTGEELVNLWEDIQEGTLITKEVVKKREWRVHVLTYGDYSQLYVTKKTTKNGERLDNTVSNHQNGFIFKRKINAQDISSRLLKIALECAYELGLDFCSVDIAEDYNGIFHVLEANTATGVTGITGTIYSDFFDRIGRLPIGMFLTIVNEDGTYCLKPLDHSFNIDEDNEG